VRGERCLPVLLAGAGLCLLALALLRRSFPRGGAG
jgi:hypothetical protein